MHPPRATWTDAFLILSAVTLASIALFCGLLLCVIVGASR